MGFRSLERAGRRAVMKGGKDVLSSPARLNSMTWFTSLSGKYVSKHCCITESANSDGSRLGEEKNKPGIGGALRRAGSMGVLAWEIGSLNVECPRGSSKSESASSESSECDNTEGVRE